MKTTVVCGLLGSGKTTFIQNYLQQSSQRAVVLVNEFGKAGIDGEIFSAGGVEAIELPSGCVCCTLRFDLITTIERIIREFSPDHLIIEPSGVAAPSGVLEALDSLGITGVQVIGIADATEFAELYDSGMFGAFFRDQVLNSDVVLVNKVDLADEGTVRRTISLVEGLNPAAVVVATVRAVAEIPLPPRVRGGRRPARAGSRLSLETVSRRLGTTVPHGAAETFFAELSGGRFGEAVRAKALLRTDRGPFRFDLSFGKVDCAAFEGLVEDGRLVVIGEGLDREGIMGAFAGHP